MVDESRSLLETPRKRQKIDWACLKTWLPISHHFHDWKAPLARALHVKWRYTKYLGFSFITEGHQRKASGKENPLEDQELDAMMQEDEENEINYAVRKAERKSTWQRNLASVCHWERTFIRAENSGLDQRCWHLTIETWTLEIILISCDCEEKLNTVL